MKKMILIAFALLITAGGAAFSQNKVVIEPAFVPVSPEVMGMGGAFVASAHGYNSFFYNPAGFARPGGSFTIASATAWVYSRPDQVYGILSGLSAGSPDFGVIVGLVNQQLTGGGFGVGTSQGIGIAGSGLGLGAVTIVDSYLWGPTTLGISGYANATVGFIGGLAIPIDLLGIKLSVGADIRPMVRIKALLPNSKAIALVNSLLKGGDPFGVLQGASAMHGVGIALDAGAMAELGGLTVALSARDILGTKFSYTPTTVGAVLTSLQNGGTLPMGEPITNVDYVIPMGLSGGISFHPDLGGLKFLIDPMVSVDLQDIIGVLSGGQSPWKLLHAGGEVTLLSLFAVRAGLNQGYVTLGAGIKLLFLDANFAVFTRELGDHMSSKPNSGMTFEFALRF